MIKVKTFTTELKIFHVARELEHLDAEVNDFLAQNKVTKVLSVSDATTSGSDGATIGLIRVLAYEA